MPDVTIFDEYKEALSALLPVYVFEQASKYRFFQGVQRKILGDALMRMAVWMNFGVEPKQLIIALGSAGKPYLISHPDIHFNISHSGQWVVVAVADCEIGIDVERIKKVNLRIAERFFSESEKQQLFGLPENLQTDFFFDLWTLKESFLKAIGTGLTKPLKSFTVVVQHDQALIMEKVEKSTLFLKQLNIEAGYKLAVCSCGDKIADNLIIVDVWELIAELRGINN